MKSLREHLNESMLVEAANVNAGRISLDWVLTDDETQECFEICFPKHEISFREKSNGEMEFTWTSKNDFINLMGYLVARYSPNGDFLTFDDDYDNDGSLAFYISIPLFKQAKKLEKDIIAAAQHVDKEL